jgi:hypothetical protein
LKKLVAALICLAAFAPAALAATSFHFLKVSPGQVNAGNTIKLSGSISHTGCPTGHKTDAVTLYSKAFSGVTKSKYKGVSSISVPTTKKGVATFSKSVKLSVNLNPGTYTITGHCGRSSTFGSTKLKVAPNGFYG